MSINIEQVNAELKGKSPEEVVQWGVDFAQGKAIVSTNFRPHEAVILHSEQGNASYQAGELSAWKRWRARR